MATNPLELAAPPGPRIVVTIFYNATDARASRNPPTSPRGPHDALPSLRQATLSSLASGTVPTENLDSYPLEPPTPGPDPSDHLYGSYVSQSCVADFLNTLKAVVPHFDPASCVVRDLDDTPGGRPRVREATLELPPTGAPSLAALRGDETLSRFERTWSVELVLQRAGVFRAHKRLAVFDMDSTLIRQEVIDELAAFVGVADQVSAITAAAMNGELDFEQSLRARCRLLRGVPSDVWEALRDRIELTPGAEELVRALRRLGYKTAVLSGGFMPMATWLAGRLGLDHAYANNLVVSADDGGKTLTGELEGDIVHAERKRDLVRSLAEREGVGLEQVIAVGDGANDLPMMKIAGLGVAFNAKARVQMEAPARLNRESLRDVLYLLGLTHGEQEELLQ